MDSQILVFVLLFAALGLIFAEIFIPSGGFIALVCVACLLGSVYSAYVTWFAEYPVYWWTYVASVIVLIPAAIIAAFQILSRTSLGNRILLSAPSEAEVTPYQRERDHLESLIGEKGVALNLMTPGGLVNVQGERLHAISEGLMIAANTQVEIVGVRGTRVLVVPVAESQTEDETFAESDESNPSNEDGTEDQIDPFQA